MITAGHDSIFLIIHPPLSSQLLFVTLVLLSDTSVSRHSYEYVHIFSGAL